MLCITYLGALQYYFKPIREMPTGRGFADLVFIPKKEFLDVPAMILELKWNQAAETALRQIKDKKYDSILDSYHGNVLLVGINYDKKSKSRDCIIEQLVVCPKKMQEIMVELAGSDLLIYSEKLNLIQSKIPGEISSRPARVQLEILIFTNNISIILLRSEALQIC